MHLSGPSLRRALRLSTFDGIFAVQYTTLTAGTLLTAFLLALGATELQIGIVASLPLVGGLLQPLGAELIRAGGGWRRPVCVAAALVDTLLWLVSFGAVLTLPPPRSVLVVIGVLAMQQAVAAFVAVGWTSWMSDVVPRVMRGRYFGRRNFVCNALGAVTAVGAGQVVRDAGSDAVGIFLVLIAVGVVLRFASIYLLWLQPEPMPARHTEGHFFRQLAAPFRDPAFQSFIFYGMAWGFSLQIAAPFFTVYMLRELHVGVDTVMLLAGLGTVANLAGQRTWGGLADRYGEREVMRVAGLTLTLQPLWWLLTAAEGPGYYLMLVLGVTGGFASGGLLLATSNLMMRLAPEIGKTTFFAVQAALGGLFGAMGPLVGGLIAERIPPGFQPLDLWLFEGLKSLFFLSFALRIGAWLLLHRVPVPEGGRRLRPVLILRDMVRTFNPTQGFSGLLHVFAEAPREGALPPGRGRLRAGWMRRRSSKKTKASGR